MNLELILDSLDGVADEFKPFYKQIDDKYHLENDTLIALVKKNQGADEFKSMHQKMTKEMTEMKEKLIELNKLSVAKAGDNKKVDEKNTLNLKELEDFKKGVKIPDSIKETMEKNHELLQNLKKENDLLKSQREKDLIQVQVREAIAKHKGNAALLEPLISTKIKPHEGDNGVMTLRIINQNGEFEYNDSAKFKTVDEYVAELKKSKDFSPCFYSDAVSGANVNKEKNEPSDIKNVRNITENKPKERNVQERANYYKNKYKNISPTIAQ